MIIDILDILDILDMPSPVALLNSGLTIDIGYVMSV